MSMLSRSQRNLVFTRWVLGLLVIFGGLVMFGHLLPWQMPEPIAQLNRRFNPQSQLVLDQLKGIGPSGQQVMLATDTQNQLKTLAERGQLFSNEANKVFSEAVKPADSSESTADRALKFGQYLYCKQVVEEWEKTQ